MPKKTRSMVLEDVRRLSFQEFDVPEIGKEDGLLKVFVPPDGQSLDLFRAAAAEGVQVRHFVRSQTSLEDLFARAVGVD